MLTVVAFLILIVIVVFFHELGHFLVGKLFDTKIDTFSIGMGKRICGFKSGETDYRLCLLPIGGYVMFANEDGSDKSIKLDDLNDPNHKRYLMNKPTWQRFLVFAAGPLFSFLLAFVIFLGFYSYAGKTYVYTNAIFKVMENSPAKEAGFQNKDKIIAINGQKVQDWREVMILIYDNGNKSMKFTVLRQGQEAHLTVTPRFSKEAKRHIVGIVPEILEKEIKGVLPVIQESAKHIWRDARLNVVGIFYLLSGKISSKNVGGPVAIFQETGKRVEEAAKVDWVLVPVVLLDWIATFTIILGVMNLLPIYPLDGGQMVFCAIEGIQGKNISAEVKNRVAGLGFALLIMLMAFALYNDIGRLIK